MFMTTTTMTMTMMTNTDISAESADAFVTRKTKTAINSGDSKRIGRHPHDLPPRA